MTFSPPQRLVAAIAGAVLILKLAEAHSAEAAALKLPAIFGDNMVLQQQQAVPVWGWAAPGAEVAVKFAGQSKSTRADADGKWLVKLGKLKASFTPQSLVITSGETKSTLSAASFGERPTNVAGCGPLCARAFD